MDGLDEMRDVERGAAVGDNLTLAASESARLTGIDTLLGRSLDGRVSAEPAKKRFPAWGCCA